MPDGTDIRLRDLDNAITNDNAATRYREQDDDAAADMYETDPDNVNRVRMAISEASKDLILLQETLSYLQESLDEVLHRRVFTYVLGDETAEIVSCNGCSVPMDLPLRV
eukprot:3312690-Rhodomonas_salina.1